MDIAEFSLPEDGWFHIATPGEWPHKPTGLVQILDDEAMSEIVKAFVEFKAAPNWPGVLIDFDHQSLDQDKPTTAAGWIVDLEQRPTGLWAQVRWSDLGRKSIEGGRYRFISPVWKSSDCAMLGQDRIRPLKLMNCAVTNDPNIKGLFPLSNSETAPIEFSPPAMPIENRQPLTLEQQRAIWAKGGRGGGSSPGTAAASPVVGQGPATNQPPTIIGDPSAAHMRGQPGPPAPPTPDTITGTPDTAYWSPSALRPPVETVRTKARMEAVKARQRAEIQWMRADLLRRAHEDLKNPSPARNALAFVRFSMRSSRGPDAESRSASQFSRSLAPPVTDPRAIELEAQDRAREAKRFRDMGYVQDATGKWTKSASASYVPGQLQPAQYTSTSTWIPGYPNRRAGLGYVQNSIRAGLNGIDAMTEQQRKWWFATMSGQRGGGSATRDHDMRISSYNQQIAALEASRRERPELFAPDGIRNWRDTRDRLMRAGADSGTILAAIAADKAHNANVRDFLRAQKRSIKRRYKDKGAQERALERERRSEIKAHDAAVKAWQREDDRITREIRRLEGRRDEEVAKASDSELKSQAKDAVEAGKHQRAVMAAFARAYSEYQRTERERARVQGRQELAEWRANEVMRRQAASEAERQAREEMRRNDPVTLARQESQRVREFNNAVLRGDWSTATQLNTGGNLSALRKSMSEIARDVGPRDRDRAAKLLTSELDRYHQTVYGEQHWGA